MCVHSCASRTLPQSRPSPLRDDHARFYAASVICGLEYMQDRNLMWRCVYKGPDVSCRAVNWAMLCCVRELFQLLSTFFRN